MNPANCQTCQRNIPASNVNGCEPTPCEECGMTYIHYYGHKPCCIEGGNCKITLPCLGDMLTVREFLFCSVSCANEVFGHKGSCGNRSCNGGEAFNIRGVLFCSPSCGNEYFNLESNDSDYWPEDESGEEGDEDFEDDAVTPNYCECQDDKICRTCRHLNYNEEGPNWDDYISCDTPTCQCMFYYFQTYKTTCPDCNN